MKSNLAILSSDKKSINFIKNLNLKKFCNLYANCSRNVNVAEKFSKEYNFKKYYGSYEELLEDQDIDYLINFLPPGIKFEYTYLFLKKKIKVITDYPVISTANELDYFEEIIKKDLISNLFLIDNLDYANFYKKTSNHKYITYHKKIKKNQDLDNSLSNADILFELSPDLFFFINKHKKSNIKVKVFDKINDKITNKINFLRCLITIDTSIKLHVIIDNSHTDNSHFSYGIDNTNEIKDSVFNKENLINFINSKKPFDNLSDFQYYPFKLFQGVFNE